MHTMALSLKCPRLIAPVAVSMKAVVANVVVVVVGDSYDASTLSGRLVHFHSQ